MHAEVSANFNTIPVYGVFNTAPAHVTPMSSACTAMPPDWLTTSNERAGLVAKVQLNSGHSMPLLGFGTWKAEPTVVGEAVRAALQVGYRHIDAAAVYANEAEVGGAFAELVGDGEGKIPRAQLFVTSKLWNTEHAPEHVRPALEQTLRDLRLDYLDLYLIHWPQAFQKVEGTTRGFPRTPDGGIVYNTSTPLADTWRALEACVDAGLVRSIGVSTPTRASSERGGGRLRVCGASSRSQAE